MDRDLRLRAPDWRPARQADTSRQHPRDEWRQLSPRPEPRPQSQSRGRSPPMRIGPGGPERPVTRQLSGERARQGAHPIPTVRKHHAELAHYPAAMWLGFPPPLTGAGAAGGHPRQRHAVHPLSVRHPPGNLQSELNRVKHEVQTIFDRYFAEWQALTPPVLSNTQGEGNPPVLQGTGYDAVRILGGLLNFDENMSPFRNEACAFCHMPYAAFSGPIPSVNLTMVAYPGSYRYRAAKRTAQRYTYSWTFPVLYYNSIQGLFFGGNFWDGRPTGFKLQSPDAEQAQHPPVDTLEMGLPDTACIALRISQAAYRPLFELVWGADFDISWPSNVEQICSTPGGTFPNAMPIALSPENRTKANNIYNHWGQSISFLEHTPDVSPFNSKFDQSQSASSGVNLTPDEAAGFALFNGKGNCNSCHVDGRSTTLMPGQADTGNAASVQ